MDLDTSVSDKKNDFSFPIVNFPFLDGDVHLATSYGGYIYQLIRFTCICNNVSDFNDRNFVITEKLLHPCYHYTDIVNKYNSTCRYQKGYFPSMFYGDIFNKAKKSDKSKLVKYLKNLIRKGYDLATIAHCFM